MFDKNTLWNGLTTYDIKELEGFEELIELWGKNNISKGSNKKKGKDLSLEYREILNFLENEYFRLDKIYHFLNHKVSTLKEADQKDSLINFEKERLEMAKEKLYKIFTSSSSSFHMALGDIFNKSFKITPKS